jgi:hypothetical protein
VPCHAGKPSGLVELPCLEAAFALEALTHIRIKAPTLVSRQKRRA